MYKISLLVYKMPNFVAKQILNKEESHIHPAATLPQIYAKTHKLSYQHCKKLSYPKFTN